MIATIILGVALACIVLGALLGLIRGMNRAILRLVIVIACVIGALLLVSTITNLVLGIQLKEGVTLLDTIINAFGESSELPESISTLILTLIEIILGLVIFIVCFILLLLLSWAIVYPILKLFVGKGLNKRSLLGMIVGAIQGVIVAFVLCVPLNGIASGASKITSLDLIKDANLIPQEITEQLGLDEYSDSATYKFIDSTGGWFYNLLTSKETDSGSNVSIDDAIDVVIVTNDVAKEATSLTANLEKVTGSEATVQDKVSSLKGVGDSLINIGTSLNSLSDGGKQIIQNVLTDVVSSFLGGGEESGGEESGEETKPTLPPAVVEVIENINVNDLSLESTGEAIKGISSYIEKTSEGFENYGEEVTTEEVQSIVNGIEDNSFILSLVTGGAENVEEVPTLIEVQEEDAEKFETAISQADKLSNEEKDILKKLLGLA